MDAQAIVLILGAIGGLIAAGGAVLVAYKKATAPHSALLGLIKMLWHWLDFTEPNERIIAKMKAGGSIASGIPEHVRTPIVRVVYTGRELKEQTRASRALEEEDDPDAE